MTLNREENMLFTLLRSALSNDEHDMSPFSNATADDWLLCQKLAANQGVLALSYDGVKKLSLELQPPKSVKISWAMAVERCEARYHSHCRAIYELSKFYAKHGVRTVQMKGVALSAYYPNPSHRQCGDLDIFTYSADTSLMSHKEANRFANKLIEELGIYVEKGHSVKHSEFNFKGAMVENHKTFINVETYKLAGETDKLLRQLIKPEPLRLEGKYEILVASPEFNTIFLPFHAAQHYGSGLSIHHLCDWACLIKKYGLNIPDGMTDKRFRRTILALTWVCNEYLGTKSPIEDKGVKTLAEEILSEILHPPFTNTVPTKNPVSIILYKTRRLMHRQKLCDSVLGISLAKVICDSIVIHLRHPKTIFKRERN